MVDANAGGPGSSNRRPLGMAAVAGSGAEFAVVIAAGAFAGQWLDRRLGTAPWLVIVGTFVAAGAGFYRLVRALRGAGARTGGGAKR
jgi:F0F1-type ATP synthase assembly protein I